MKWIRSQPTDYQKKNINETKWNLHHASLLKREQKFLYGEKRNVNERKKDRIN